MTQQLDIFDDSGDTALRNDLADALLAGDADAAQRIADTLVATLGADHVLAPAAALLIEYLRGWPARAGQGSMAVHQVRNACQCLDGPIAAAAGAVLGTPAAATWLASQWCSLAVQAAGISWQPAHADVHAAALYLRAQAWPSAAEAVSRIASWRQIPKPLMWMAQACWRRDGADAAWPLLAESLWLAPASAGTLVAELADRDLRRLIARFEERWAPAATAGADWAWLPAFVLVERPLLAGPLAGAAPAVQAPPSQAFAVVAALLRLERQGRHHEIVAHRARLQSLSAPLFAAYMSTR